MRNKKIKIMVVNKKDKSVRTLVVLTLFLILQESAPVVLKSPPDRITLRRSGIMSRKRPAAGGESILRDFFVTCVLS